MLQIERLPKPSGNFLVGFQHTSLTDSSRNLGGSSQGKTARELPIMIWYPASSVEGCEAKHYQPEKAFQLNYDLHYSLIGSLPWPLGWFFLRTFRKIKYVDILTNSYINAPPITTPEKLPLLIFFEGYTSLMTQNSILFEHLASHGYVVISVGVPQESVAEYPDGRITGVEPWVLTEMMKKDNLLTNKLIKAFKNHARTGLAQLIETTRIFYAPTAKDANANMLVYTEYVHQRMKIWYTDLLFVLAHLDDLLTFRDRLAGNKVGVLGMSMGGGVASCAAYYKAPGVAATLSLDGCHYGMPYDAKIEIPHMILHGYDTSRLLFERMEKDAYSVKVADTAHLDFMDQTLLEPVYRELGYTGKKVNPQVMLDIMNTYALAFFNKYVGGVDASEVLKGKPRFNNIELETK